MPEVVPGLLRGVSERGRAWRRAGRAVRRRRAASVSQRGPPFGEGEILSGPVAPVPRVSVRKALLSSGPAAEALLCREVSASRGA